MLWLYGLISEIIALFTWSRCDLNVENELQPNAICLTYLCEEMQNKTKFNSINKIFKM